uniref:Integrase catalytic domain-containing protein n=1 Tax=Arundo donax TaxID=35708 RepID=A0A0A9A0G2_ARUDO
MSLKIMSFLAQVSRLMLSLFVILAKELKVIRFPIQNLLAYPKTPLELVFSNVWGPAPTSIGRFTYYVSFIDDFRKYTWIYLLRKKSDVFQVFHNFQNLVERKFGEKNSYYANRLER